MRDTETVMSAELQFSYSNQGSQTWGNDRALPLFQSVVARDPIVGQGKKAVKRKVDFEL